MEGEKPKKRGRFRRFGSKTLHSDKLMYTFLRSFFSSQLASWIDFATSFVFFAWIHLTAVLSTAIGSVGGGLFNCVLNYKFTFHAQGVDWRAVWVKYLVIWIFSAVLNTFGTDFLYSFVKHWEWLHSMGFEDDGYYALARLLTSGIVSGLWNFPLQRCFVYKTTKYDKYAIAFCEKFRFKKKVKDGYKEKG